MVQNFRQIQSFIVGSSSFIITPTQVLGASSTALFAPLVTTQECSCDDVTDNAVAEGILDLLALSPHQMLLHLPCLQATIQGLAATSATDATSKVVNPPIPTVEGHNVVKTIEKDVMGNNNRQPLSLWLQCQSFLCHYYYRNCVYKCLGYSSG